MKFLNLKFMLIWLYIKKLIFSLLMIFINKQNYKKYRLEWSTLKSNYYQNFRILNCLVVNFINITICINISILSRGL